MEGTSTVRIQAPDSDALMKSGVSAFGSVPVGRKACYGVSISAADIESRTATCSPPTGLVAGFKEANATLELEVPRGQNRKIDLFMYLLPTGDNSACPTMGASLAGANLSATFLIGTATNVNLVSDHEIVEIRVNFPGVNAHVGQQFSLPASCLAESLPTTKVGFGLSAAQGTAAGGNIRLNGRVGVPTPGKEATGGGIKLINGSVH